MFDRYDKKIEYIAKSEQTDMFGYSSSEPVEKYVRYIGGKTVEINDNNKYRVETRLVYQCPFKVEEGDKFKIDNNTYTVKYSEEIPDVFGKTIYWEAEIL